MAKINNFKDTEGSDKEQQFLNCNKTMREHFCWGTGSIEQLSAQQAISRALTAMGNASAPSSENKSAATSRGCR